MILVKNGYDDQVECFRNHKNDNGQSTRYFEGHILIKTTERRDFKSFKQVAKGRTVTTSWLTSKTMGQLSKSSQTSLKTFLSATDYDLWTGYSSRRGLRMKKYGKVLNYDNLNSTATV